MYSATSPVHPTFPLPGPHKSRKYLEQYGFKPRSLWKRGYMHIATIIVLAIGVGIALHLLTNLAGTDVAVAITALGTLMVGFVQWREARHENSMDKYYERLDFANRRRENGKGVAYEMDRALEPEASEPDRDRMMYVYAELDNLEYVAEKYRLGYMTARQACRGLRAFQRRCFNRDFRNLALKRVQSGDYNRGTARIVARICQEFDAIPEESREDRRSEILVLREAPRVRRLQGRLATMGLMVLPALLGGLVLVHRHRP